MADQASPDVSASDVETLGNERRHRGQLGPAGEQAGEAAHRGAHRVTGAVRRLRVLVAVQLEEVHDPGIVIGDMGAVDLDTLLLMFGGIMVADPFIADKFRVEGAFSFMFLGIVVVLLVLVLWFLVPEFEPSVEPGSVLVSLLARQWC